MQQPVMIVFTKRDAGFPFLSTEGMMNQIDTVWPYWNLLDFTRGPAGPGHAAAAISVRVSSEFLERHIRTSSEVPGNNLAWRAFAPLASQFSLRICRIDDKNFAGLR
jgi:hypothetical protein